MFEGNVCALRLYIQSMNDIQAFSSETFVCSVWPELCVVWSECIAGSVSLKVTSGSVSDCRKVVRVRRGYVSVQLRWIDRLWELGSVGGRVIAAGFLDPPFSVTVGTKEKGCSGQPNWNWNLPSPINFKFIEPKKLNISTKLMCFKCGVKGSNHN